LVRSVLALHSNPATRWPAYPGAAVAGGESVAVILAQRILDCLRSNGPISTHELPKWFGEVDRIDLDITVTRLMKQNSVSLELGKYDLVEQKASNGRAPFIATPVNELPTAAEETAASLMPPVPITRERFECSFCRHMRFDAEFRHSSLGKRFNVWKYCDKARTQRAREKRGESNMAGGRATLTAEDSLGLGGESSGPDRLPPVNGGSGENGATCGGNPPSAALLPDGAKPSPTPAPSNTSTEATTVSLETSHEKQPPVAADSATGRTDVFLERVEQRRIKLGAAAFEIEAQREELDALEALYRELMA
jgi:hypothetical protein